MSTIAANANPRLDALRIDLDKTDRHIVGLMSKRLGLVRKIEAVKFANGEPVLVEKTEQEKLDRLAAFANEKGLSIPFVRGLFYSLFSESCRTQTKQRDQRDEQASAAEDEETRYKRLKQNLLDLTELLVPEYKGTYKLSSFGTISYLDFELDAIKTQVSTLASMGNTKLAIDLGCGVGIVSLSEHVTPFFEQVRGFDISPHMIGQALWIRNLTQGDAMRASFEVLDIEKRLPLEDGSVSFVAMTLGTASDVKNIRKVLASIRRVLNKDGRFVLSFYNSAALFYRWSLPWEVNLMAEINPTDHCLDVHVGGRVFQLYARPYTVREVKKLLADAQLHVSSVSTYPALAAIMPNELFYGVDEAQRASHRKEVQAALLQEQETKRTIQRIDKGLAGSDMGAYILVTGRKT